MFNKIARLILVAFLIWLISHLFFFQVLNIPSASMKPTFNEGDFILVNKLCYGARLPETPLSLPFADSKIYLDWIKWPYLRLPGYSHVKHNDIVVFNLPSETDLPVDERTFYVKRCVALPGDTLLIDSGKVYVNKKRIENGFELPENSIQNKTFYNPNFFPHFSSYKWNLDYFGPLTVPGKGIQIKLSNENLYIYRSIIEDVEKNKIQNVNGVFYLNGLPVSTYTFKTDYYFMLGDNRHNSIDSRYWGFVPENHIVGNVLF